MARISNSSSGRKRTMAHSGKGKPSHLRQSEHADVLRRKPSMEAYYRPRHRGFIDACLRDMDDIDQLSNA